MPKLHDLFSSLNMSTFAFIIQDFGHQLAVTLKKGGGGGAGHTSKPRLPTKLTK